MKRVILTGGTGFVGANLARRLLREGHEAHLLVRPNYQPWRIEQIRPDVRLHEVRLHDSEAVSRIVSQIRPDWAFHLPCTAPTPGRPIGSKWCAPISRAP